MQYRGLISVLFPLMLLVVGCQEKAVTGYEYFEKVPKKGWAQSDEFFFSSKDLKTGVPYDILLVLRLKQDMPYRSLPLGITKELPTRTFETKVVEVEFFSTESPARQKGYNIMELVTPLERQAQFPSSGVYTYSVRHLSTDSLVQGVIEVGLIIQPSRDQ